MRFSNDGTGGSLRQLMHDEAAGHQVHGLRRQARLLRSRMHKPARSVTTYLGRNHTIACSGAERTSNPPSLLTIPSPLRHHAGIVHAMPLARRQGKCLGAKYGRTFAIQGKFSG